MKRTTMATEAQFLLMRYAFEDLHFRRYKYKCDSLNTPSRHATERLSFCHEGAFRNAVIHKGRSRDTLWFSIIDTEQANQKSIFEQYLSPSNFYDNGQPIKRLGDFFNPQLTSVVKSHAGELDDVQAQKGISLHSAHYLYKHTFYFISIKPYHTQNIPLMHKPTCVKIFLRFIIDPNLSDL